MNNKGLVPVAIVVLAFMAVWIMGFITSQKAMREEQRHELMVVVKE